MCAVSMVTDHFRDKWPPALLTTQQQVPYVAPPPQLTWEQWSEYQTLKRKAAEYDARTGQAHCEKDGVADWEARVEQVLRDRYGLEPK